MKRILFFLLVTTLLGAACNNNKPKETGLLKSPDGKEKVTNDPKQLALQQMEKQKEELGKLTPLSSDQLKALVPETLMGAPISNQEVSTAIGANVASGEYEINDSTRITLSVYDCSGPAGAGIYGLNFAGLMNDLHDDEEEYLRSIDFKGGKAFEQCDKSTHECTLSYFSGGRFLVTLEGDHAGADLLRQAANGLYIK